MILYQGPSLLDGKEIIVIGTKGSNNRKTGSMLQTWILRADMKPGDAIRSGDDKSICGDCQSRPINKSLGTGSGDCYVNMQAPSSIYSAFKRGSYPRAKDLNQVSLFGSGEVVRLGSYGDPAAVPTEIWEALIKDAIGHTGYTHQWRLDLAQPLRTLCMASCDSSRDYDHAREKGWRTFRVIRDNESIVVNRGEFRCPSDPLLDHHIPCFKCKACNGHDDSKRSKGNPFIITHGFRAKKEQSKVNAKLQVLN